MPRLLPLGEVKATVFMGLIWGPWHAPLLLAGLNYPYVNFWVALLVFCFVVVGLSFAYTWFYIASGGSVLIAAVLHASFNNFSNAFWVPPLLSGANQFTPSLDGGVVMVTLVVFVYGMFKRPMRVGDADLYVRPKLDGTKRDWVH